MLLAAGCAATDAGPADGPRSPTRGADAFDQRADQVAEAWRPGPDWRAGYVPLQEPTVLTGDPGFTPETEAAFRAGWYRARSDPADPGPRRRDPVPGRTAELPLVSAAEAYRQLDQGDPPPCAGAAQAARPTQPAGGPTVEPGPDGWCHAAAPQTACLPLTVTAVTLGTAPVRTSRGEAQVPAWLFTVEELATPVARLAVAPTAVTRRPRADRAGPAAAGRRGRRPGPRSRRRRPADRAARRRRLRHRDHAAGAGAADDVVVVGGGVTRATGECIALLKLEPVTVTLKAPLGGRPVLDVLHRRAAVDQHRADRRCSEEAGHVGADRHRQHRGPVGAQPGGERRAELVRGLHHRGGAAVAARRSR